MNTQTEYSMIPRIGDEQVVSACWERFVRNGAVPPARVRNIVLESWQRCHSEAVDPARAVAPGIANKDVLQQLRNRNQDLYDAARPVLESLRGILRECGTLVMLSDPVGCIIDLNGESRARHAGERINLAAGGCWVEEVIGTNAIGTAIASRQPVQIYASEHYCIDVKQWTCAAAPILDRFGNSLLGVIDVSGVKDTFHGHTLGLVISAAKQIEGILLGRDLDRQNRLLELSMDAFSRYVSDCVILFDQRGRLIRSNSRMQQARERYGVRLPLERGTQVPALNLALSAAERAALADEWLRPEWLHELSSGGELQGTLMIIPLSVPDALPRAACEISSSDPIANIVGGSPAMSALRARARRLASLDLPVLLLGETGAGKEVVARNIHLAGAKPEAPFIAVNCGALTRELLASELFGYAEGAFTGARRGGLAGKFEQAHGGTLFLDEIGEMPLEMQPHLLRVLQDGVVVRLGDTRERKVAVRIIAATNRDLRQEALAGRFREDLYHRLCVTSLQLPPLRQRIEDIPLLLEHMNHRLAEKYGCTPRLIAPEVLEAFQRYSWPGNVRELQNTFEVLFALCEGDMIEASQLTPELSGSDAASAAPSTSAQSLAQRPGRLDEIEKQAVMDAVHQAGGNLSRAARILGISRSTLYSKLANMPEPGVAVRKQH
ncbi:MAG TPA: sigma-54-dependent Fis family transcriptional regulator [Rhodocyclaceae bacterium]